MTYDKEKRRAFYLKYRDRYKEKSRASSKLYAERHKEKKAAYRKAYRAKNRVALLLWAQKYSRAKYNVRREKEVAAGLVGNILVTEMEVPMNSLVVKIFERMIRHADHY